MMHKNPNERIKLSQIKGHAWFSLYKVSFLEAPPEVAMRHSNLITDSMLLEGGEDPFEDFMNKRLKNSQSSGGKSADDYKVSLNGSEFGFGAESSDDQRAPLAFKKEKRFSDNAKDNLMDHLPVLEVIPEERGVVSPDASRITWTSIRQETNPGSNRNGLRTMTHSKREKRELEASTISSASRRAAA